MRRFIAHALVLASLAVLAGGVVVLFGLYNVSARLGHLPGTYTLLHTTYEQSVKLYSKGPSTVPADLDDPDRVVLGAGHFEQACRFCHAAPGERQSATVSAMNPKPPHVSETTEGWEPNHLFWILDEGVKMSGMPAWPTDGRDDGVWNVVAFLEAVRDGMSFDEYNAMIGREPEGQEVAAASIGGSEKGPDGIEACTICHGTDGQSRSAHIPRLDILGATYIEASLDAYRQGTRQSGFMRHAATVVEPDELAALGEWYANQPVGGTTGLAAGGTDLALVAEGERLAHLGDERGDSAACVACHGPNRTRQSALFPNIAGQNAAYIETQLHAFKERTRGGTRLAHLMYEVANDLDADAMAALAAYYASLPPEPIPSETASTERADQPSGGASRQPAN